MITKAQYQEAKQRISQYEAEASQRLLREYSCLACKQRLVSPLHPATSLLCQEEGMWQEGTVIKVAPGYGSTLDGSIFYAGLCDPCMNEALEEGLAVRYTDLQRLLEDGDVL